MTRLVALLRGINVGGRNLVSMPALASLLESLGYSGVQTYIQSGNVVFSAEQSDGAAQRIETGLEGMTGRKLAVVVRGHADLQQVARSNPFLDRGHEHNKLHVMFLADGPTAAAVATLDPNRCPPDEFAVLHREVYLLCPGGVGKSKLTIDYFERRLQTTATTRNWNTVLRLRDMTGA